MLWIPDLAPCYSLSLSLSYVHLIYSVHHSNTHYKTSRCQISHLFFIGNFKYRQTPIQGHSRLAPKKQTFCYKLFYSTFYRPRYNPHPPHTHTHTHTHTYKHTEHTFKNSNINSRGISNLLHNNRYFLLQLRV